MTTNIISVSPNDSIEKATELMAQYQIRRLPVVDSGQLIGMLALGDLAIRNRQMIKLDLP